MLTAELLDVTRRLERATRPDGERASDEDQAAATVRHELSADAHTRLVARAKALSAALDRLDDGTYGRCVVCDLAISAARLRVIPEATRCLPCAVEAERSRDDRAYGYALPPAAAALEEDA